MYIKNIFSILSCKLSAWLNLVLFLTVYIQYLHAASTPASNCLKTPLTFAAPLSPPYHTNNQQGFIDRFLNLIFSDIGCKIKIITLPAMRTLSETNKGKLDGTFMFSDEVYIDEYPNLIRIEPSYFSYFLAFTGFGKLPRSDKEVSTYRLATIRGMSLPHTLIDHQHIFLAKDLIQLTTLLQRNRVDVAIMPVAVAYFYKQQSCFKSLNITVYSELSVNLYIYLHKRHHNIKVPLGNSVRRLKRSKQYQHLLQTAIRKGLDIPLATC
ncbi:hypothetical protein H0A36_22930 [Endozoicomonas sp. SM1973]|uniref:Solute-binding protein family 3/N-terminal domain-containing protein n=1 Tax=Spartinivicinus marinus TaxID=2994442 RepID=A0A853IEB3_9GAMM|nr:hypothetical protein [Spartinivicinus marinus]MCX4027502.1 hypothetical protein [Spartinivicinus marinus]NYZ68878.1 hypothetical protein [Spartinivicinus marinus]